MIWLLIACSGSPDGTEPTRVESEQGSGLIEITLALNWFPEPEFGGFYEGVLGGHYERHGLKVKVNPGGPGAPTLEQLATGRTDIAITAADDLLVKRQKGIRALGAWPAFQLSPQGLLVHDSGPSRFEDISSGTRIAIEVGSPFQRFLWESHGWHGSVEAVPYSGGVGAFLADESIVQQAYITAEPCAATAKGATVRFLRGSDAGWNPYGSLVAFSDPPPVWAKPFVLATQEAWQAYMADPTQANAEIRRLNPEMDNDALIQCITEAQAPFLTGVDGLGTMTKDRWEAMASTLADLGLIPEGTTADGAWRVFQ
jgi:NitT/TauT family transport system substrate-binding protein